MTPVDPVGPVDGDSLAAPDPDDTLGQLADLFEQHPDPRLGADLDRALAECEATRVPGRLSRGAARPAQTVAGAGRRMDRR